MSERAVNQMSTRLKTAYTGMIIVAVMIIAVSVAGCHDPNYAEPPYYSYMIEVDGLEHFYTDAGLAHIGFPVPEYNRNVLLPFDDNVTLDNRSMYFGLGGTTLRASGPNNEYFHSTRKVEVANISGHNMAVFEIQPTDYYTIGLINANTYPPNTTGIERVSVYLLDNYTTYIINKHGTTYDPLDAKLRYDLGPEVKTARPVIDTLAAKPLYPDLGPSCGNYTRWLKYDNVSYYTTYVYIDEGLKPRDAGNYTLDIDVKFSVIVGYRLHGRGPDEYYLFVINESIPGNVTGFVPVTVQCFGNMSGRNVYQMFDSYLF